jgi:hypothetical protein
LGKYLNIPIIFPNIPKIVKKNYFCGIYRSKNIPNGLEFEMVSLHLEIEKC